MAGVALGAREGVNVLIVEVALVACHLQSPPDRFRKTWLLSGNPFFVRLLLRILLHDVLLSERLHCVAVLCRTKVNANRSRQDIKLLGFVESWQKCCRFVPEGRFEG